MSIDRLFKKLQSGKKLNGIEKDIVRNQQAVANNYEPPQEIHQILSGTGSPFQAGEFSGVAIFNPPQNIDGENYSLVGMKGGVLQVGLKSYDGGFVAGGGTVSINGQGITITPTTGNSEIESVKFVDASGNLLMMVTVGVAEDGNSSGNMLCFRPTGKSSQFNIAVRDSLSDATGASIRLISENTADANGNKTYIELTSDFVQVTADTFYVNGDIVYSGSIGKATL